MARKVGQIIARSDRRWLIRVYLGRDHETKKRNYHNRTIHGSMREAQAYLTRKLRERDLGRDLEGAKITLNEYLDRWLKTAVGPRVRPKTLQDFNIEGKTLWATNLLFGAPLEVDLPTWKPTRALRFVSVTKDAPQLSCTSHFAFDLDRRFAYFHESSLCQRERATHAEQLSLIRLDTKTGHERKWSLLPPQEDAQSEVHNFHSAFYFEEKSKRFIGLLRTGAIVESLAPHIKVSEHAVIPMNPSTIWIVEIDEAKPALQASLLPGIRELGALALSHLDVDASSRDGFVLFANYKQADVGEETHGINLYGERPEDVAEHYSGMPVEPLNYGLVFRYERIGGCTSVKTFSRPYDSQRTSLGHSWLPINIELDSRKTRLFCSFAGFRPRLLPKHIARSYGDTVVDPKRVRYVPPLLMRFDAVNLVPEYNNDRTYVSYTEPIAFALAGSYPNEFLCTFSPESGLKIYHSDDFSKVIGHAVSPFLMNWRDTHFRPDPAHMAFVSA